MNIAIIDDISQAVTRLSNVIGAYADASHIPIEITTFDNARDFLDDYRPSRYTLIFMDIYMDDMNGMEAVKRIRTIDPAALVVFLTTSPDHTFDAFQVHAYEYVLKDPENAAFRRSIFRIIDDVLALNQRFSAGISVSVNGSVKSFSFHDIVYTQNDKNYILITDSTGEVSRTRMTFTKMRSLLEKDRRFLAINRGIIINMDYIDTFGKETCTLKGGFCVPINVREHKKLDQIRRNYIFSRLHNGNMQPKGGIQP